MNQKYKLYTGIFSTLLLLASAAIAILFFMSIGKVNQDSRLDLFLGWSYILAGLGVLLAFVIAPLVGVLANPKSLGKSLISIGVLVAIVFIAYSMSSSAAPVDLNLDIKNMELAVRVADTSLYTMYILGALGFVAIVVSEIRNLLQ